METAMVKTFSSKYERNFNKLAALFGSVSGILRSKLKEAALIFRTMSTLEQRDAKRRLCKLFPFLSPVTFDWMVLVGDGVASPYWLEAKVRPPVKLFKALPAAARLVFNSPDKIVAVAGEKGVRAKRVAELTWPEMTQVLDAKKGILPPERQHVAPLDLPKVALPVARTGDSFVFDSMAKRTNGNVEIFGRRKDTAPGGWDVKVEITAAQWNSICGRGK